MSETRSTWRFYVKQWLLDSRHDSQEQALAHAHEQYGDRLTEAEMRVEPDDLGGPTWVLWTSRWGVIAEWKYEDYARFWAKAFCEDFDIAEEDCQVVERNSRAEHELTQHGVLKVAAPK